MSIENLLLPLQLFFLLLGRVSGLVSPSTTSWETRRVGEGQQFLVVPAIKEELYPPLVLIGGMAQTIKSWEHHLSTLAKNRKVLVYECLGQGGLHVSDDGALSSSSVNFQNVSLPVQANLLLKTLEEIFIETTDDLQREVNCDDTNNYILVDIAGFSFGGRVAMAAACNMALSSSSITRIRRLHLTGVATDRSDYGHLAIQAWKDNIENDPSLRSFAWSVLLATYSSKFLRSQPIERYLDHICESNSPQGLLALLEQAEITNPNDPWHVKNMADRLVDLSPRSTTTITGRLCVGELDQMAPLEHAQELSQRLGWPEPVVIPECGHAVGLEGARLWRDDLLSFLNN